MATSSRANSEDEWKYKQRLVDDFPLRSFWASFPETIRIQLEGEPKLVSLDEIKRMQEVATIMHGSRFEPRKVSFQADRPDNGEKSAIMWLGDTLAIVEADLRPLSNEHRTAVFTNRSVDSVQWSHDGHLVLYWTLNKRGEMLSRHAWSQPLEITSLPAFKVVGFRAHKTTDDVYGHGLLNASHPFVQWLIRVRESCEQNAYGLKKEQFEQLISLLETPIEHGGYELSSLVTYLEGWRSLPRLPPELYPPEEQLTEDMFVMRRESGNERTEHG